MTEGTKDSEPSGPWVCGRYRLASVLGEGGMAVVYQALDATSGRRVALKRLRSPNNGRKRAHLTALFEREFVTLSQLTHPRVVAAYDYGVDHEGPYYTMELLDGGDLQHLAPLAWRSACALGRDVCSALSLLHSRRMVYRDMSPRNVRCSEEGQAKLIDFGAMTAMGPTREVVGTPPFVAPEVLNLQPLDARTDLYALGATLYYALTRHHAYAAQSFGQLWELWRVAPPPPSAFNSQIPEALDRLVLELIHTDPALRPANAAEVMLRLSTIADLPADESLLVHQAYLSAPTLVGRERELEDARAALTRARLEGCGASFVVHGAEGSGRSRFLDECALKGKLAGLLVVRANASDAEEGDYGLLRTLVKQLLQSARAALLSAAAKDLSVLSHILPELMEPLPGHLLETLPSTELKARAEPALKALLIQLSQERPLLIAIDDLARADEPSLALLGSVAQVAHQHALVLASALSSEELQNRDRPTLALLAQASTVFALTPLELAESEQLLSSIFGEVPNLRLLASYTEQVTAGNPRDMMRLAQHLVSERVIRYASGSWSLPERLHGTRLPSTMAEALRLRVALLSATARSVAYAFAAEAKQRFALDECLTLSPGAVPEALLQVLHELLDAGVIARAGPRYRLAQLGFSAALAKTLSAQEAAQAHQSLAQVFRARGDGLRYAQHLLQAGREEEGVEALVHDAIASTQRTNASAQVFFEVLRALPHDWLSTYDLALRLCDKLRRPEADRDILLMRVCSFLTQAVCDTDGIRFIKQLLDRLAYAAGLDIYATLPDTLSPDVRRRLSFQQAKARHDATPAHERGPDPSAAIQPLVATFLTAIARIGLTNDVAAYRQLPSLAPLVAISPALMVANETARGVGARIEGRCEEAIAIYDKLLLRLNEPDHAGWTASEHTTTVLRVMLSLGALEAGIGLKRAMEKADFVESQPDYGTQGLMLRHLCLLWQGDGHEAALAKQQLEQGRASRTTHNGFDRQHLLGEICAYAFADDLTRVKEATDLAAMHAQIHHAWLPVVHYGRGEHQRIRGDFEAALVELERALALMREHTHQIWANVAGAQLRTLVELGRVAPAVALGESYLEHAEQARLGYLANYVRMPLSLALARSGNLERAAALAETAVASFLQLGSTGLNLAAAYETRARIALEAGDASGFERDAELSLAQCRSGNRRLLRVKLGRATRQRPSAEARRAQQRMIAELSASLLACPNDGERARRGLALLSRHSEAIGGVLYTWQDGGLRRAASFGDLPEQRAIDDWAELYFHAQRAAHAADTSEVELQASARAAQQLTEGSERYVPTVLTHDEPDGYRYTGLAVLVMPASADLSWLSPISIALSRGLLLGGSQVGGKIGSGVRESEPDGEG